MMNPGSVTPLALRRASPADAPAILELTRIAYAKWVALIAREPRPMTANYDKAVREHLIDLYEGNGKLLALIEMIPGADHLLIENIAVNPDYQGRGLGKSMLRHAEHIARSNGVYELKLYTNAAFESNVAFYARHGFTETHRESLPDGGQLVHRDKQLSRTHA